MVLSAANALTLSTNSQSSQDEEDLQTEVTLAETSVSGAAGRGLTMVKFNATILGNPTADPYASGALSTATQQEFRDAFGDAGYTVGWDEDSGYWTLDWSAVGAEQSVVVYSFRTILNPAGSVSTNTIAAINGYFGALTPVAHSRATLVSNIDETVFGATASTFYEYVIVVDQADATDHTTALKAYVIAQMAASYNSSNCHVYKTV